MDFHNGYFVKKCEKIESLSVLKLQVCNLIREEFVEFVEEFSLIELDVEQVMQMMFEDNVGNITITNRLVLDMDQYQI